MRSFPAVLLLISVFFVKVARSQSNELLIQGQTGKLYLEHSVVAKENWYSVGRLYNISPKELTTFNQLALTQPLVIGQTLQIPLTAVNFSQTGQKGPTETLVPVYHIIQEKEWMYRISVNHNKVPIPSLEKWNNINKDQVHPGMHLIVGYLKVKTALSALASAGAVPAVAGGAPAGTPAPVGAGKVGTPAGTGGASVAAVKGDGGAKFEEGGKAADDGGAAGTGSVGVKEGSSAGAKAAKPASAKTDAGDEGKDSSSVGAKVVNGKAAGVKKAEPKEVAATPAVVKQPVTPAPTPVAATVATASHNGGIFKGDFSESGKSVGGSAGTFKSTSGWQDGKYYALMNNAPVGTIVKVNDLSTGKSIYAKILGQLPDMKESAGLSIRISNAAAAELGEGEGRFNVDVKY